MEAVQSPVIPIVADWIRSQPGTISLGQGVVAYGPPPSSREQVDRFFNEPDIHKYKPVEGLPELTGVIREKLASENRIRTGPGQGASLAVTAGGNMAFMNAVLAITDPGDEVILQTPYYFNHEMAVTIAGCRPVLVPTDSNYQLQPDRIRDAVTPRTRAVVTVSPNNPTGAVYPEPALREVNDLCRDRGLYHIHDEAYEYFTWNGAAHFSPGSIPGAAPHTFSLFSLSKAYGFASWRIGYMTLPDALMDAVKKIQDTLLICPPVISQYAALGALRAGAAYCRDQLAVMVRTRSLVLEQLEELRGVCEVPVTDGAFYFLLRARGEADSVELTRRLIREHRVAVIPGTAFGLDQGCHLRVAYGALEPATAREGIGRLVTGLKKLLVP
jgi:aspartate/methionine/tyrosine aminotransferase